MSFPHVINGYDGAQHDFGSTKLFPLGTQMVLEDARTFRYGLNNATNASFAGDLQQAEAPDANFDELAYNTNPAVGDLSMSITNGATAIVADDYLEGWAVTNNTNSTTSALDAGYMYRLATHLAVATTAAGTFNFYGSVDVVAVFATGGEVALVRSPYAQFIICPTTLTREVIGVAAARITAAQFGWVQTRGPCAVLTEGTPVIGTHVGAGTTAGAVTVDAGTADLESIKLGYTIEIGISTEWSTIFLTIE